MRKQFPLLATLTLAVFSTLSLTITAQQMDCSKAATTAEQSQCADNELSTAERDLQSAFTEAIQHYSPAADETSENKLPRSQRDSHSQYEKTMRDSLELSQKTWLQYRTAACAAVLNIYEGGTMGPVAASLCKAELAKQRARFLRDNFGKINESAQSANP
jgi:uncharacterized protein YecT (DUF1311 family)